MPMHDAQIDSIWSVLYLVIDMIANTCLLASIIQLVLLKLYPLAPRKMPLFSTHSLTLLLVMALLLSLSLTMQMSLLAMLLSNGCVLMELTIMWHHHIILSLMGCGSNSMAQFRSCVYASLVGFLSSGPNFYLKLCMPITPLEDVCFTSTSES